MPHYSWVVIGKNGSDCWALLICSLVRYQLAKCSSVSFLPRNISKLSLQSYISLTYYIQSVTSLMLTVKRRPIKCSNKEVELSLCYYFTLFYQNFQVPSRWVHRKCKKTSWIGAFLTTLSERWSMLLCTHCPLIASTIPLNSSLRYTEIIASDNGSSTLCKHVFFSLQGSIITAQSTTAQCPKQPPYISQLSLSILPLTLPFTLNLSGPLSHCLLPICAYHTKGGTVILVLTHSVPH